MLALDLLLAALGWFAALRLLVKFEGAEEYGRVALESLPVVLATYGVSLLVFRVHATGVRLGSQEDLQKTLSGALLAALALPAALFLSRLGWEVSPAACFFSPLLTGVLMLAIRFAFRAWKERSVFCITRWRASPVVILGAGAAGRALLEELEYGDRWYAVALLDDNPSKHGSTILGVKVLGSLDTVGTVFRRLGATHAVLAMPAANPASRMRAIELCHTAGIPVLTVPTLDDLQARRRGIFELRRPQIRDLVGAHVPLDFAALRALVGGRTVLVCGAAGLVGLQVCHLVASFRPAKLVLCDTDDSGLYSAEQEFRARPYLRVQIDITQCDPKDSAGAAEIFSKHRPEIVFHAVAYSPVPLAETDNASQIAKKTVLGPVVMMRAAIDAGAREFVLVSTDKAINPTSVVGASARLAELVCQQLQRESSLKLVVARLGDVLGERGSVLAKVQEQVARRSILTVPHKESERYFVAADEAARIVLMAAMMGQGNETYAADMGPRINIAGLARQLALLSGMKDRAIRIEYTDLPGEKIRAENPADPQKTYATAHPLLRASRETYCTNPELRNEVIAWLNDSRPVTREAVLDRIHTWIRECDGSAMSDKSRHGQKVVQQYADAGLI